MLDALQVGLYLNDGRVSGLQCLVPHPPLALGCVDIGHVHVLPVVPVQDGGNILLEGHQLHLQDLSAVMERESSAKQSAQTK